MMQLLTSRSTHTHDDNEQEGQCAANSGLKVLLSSAMCAFKSFVTLIPTFPPDVLERCYLRQVHNCVYFAVKVLKSQFQ